MKGYTLSLFICLAVGFEASLRRLIIKGESLYSTGKPVQTFLKGGWRSFKFQYGLASRNVVKRMNYSGKTWITGAVGPRG